MYVVPGKFPLVHTSTSSTHDITMSALQTHTLPQTFSVETAQHLCQQLL
jgi:hypothetical protein